ncbi:MAG: GumC family protein [Rhizomicrobium sp.]
MESLQTTLPVPKAAAWPPPAAALEIPFQLPDLLRLTVRRHRLILGIAAACIALTACVLMLLPTLYSASAVVMLEQRRNNVADASSVLSSLPTDPTSVQNQIQILTSRDLASLVVDKLGLENDPEFRGTMRFAGNNPASRHEEVVSAFLNHLSVENEGLSTAISIGFKARSAQKAARIANAVAGTYVQSQLDAKFAATRDTTNWLEFRVRDLSRQVQTADAAVEQYKAEHNLSESAAGVPLSDQQIAAISAQLLQAKADLAQKQATLASVKTLTKSGNAADMSQAIASPVIIQLRSQEADLIRSEAELATKYGPKHPKLIAVESQKRDLEQKIALEVKRLAGSLASDVSVSHAQVASLESSLSGAEQQAQAQNFLRVKLKSLEVNAASIHSIYEAFVSRLRSIQDQNAIEASDARVISHAAVPIAPSFPRRGLILAGSVPVSLLLGLLVALLMERFAPIVQVRSPVAQPGVPLLADISGVTHPRAIDLVLDWPDTPYAQTVQRLTSDVLGRTSKVLLVTSPQHEQGAAILAISIARAAAKTGRRVALIDANLDAPAMASLISHTAPRGGLAEVLSGKARLSESMARDSRSHVLLLSSAQARGDANRMFGSAQFAQLLQHLRGSCDLLVISAPAALSESTQVLARQADSVMLVTQGGDAPPEVGSAMAVLAQAAVGPVGLVRAS